MLGWNSAAAHAAARDTARFSVACFIIGFAAPQLASWVRWLPSEETLIHAFFGAHMVHFATVWLVLMKFDRGKSAQHALQVMLVVLIGGGLVPVAGLTATPKPSWSYRILHPVALYAVFLAFLVAFDGNPVKPMRLVAIPLVAALVLRLSRSRRWVAQAEKIG